MASADDIARTIEPGSLDQGDRQAVAGQLQQALGAEAGGQPAPAGAAAPTAAPIDQGPTDPLEELLGGGHSSDLPVTSGLSLGPGAGPAGTADAFRSSPTAAKLRVIAESANSPVLRKLARDALRRELRRTL